MEKLSLCPLLEGLYVNFSKFNHNLHKEKYELFLSQEVSGEGCQGLIGMPERTF